VQFVLYAFSVLFVGLSFFMLFAFYRTQHVGLLAMSAVYGVSGMAAGYFQVWWPLLAGFVLAWVLRFMGLDPDVPRAGRKPDQDTSGPPAGGSS